MALAGRVQLIEELLTRVNSLAWVGGVVENGGDDKGLAQAHADGKVWVKFLLSEDESDETPDQRGAPLATFVFDVMFIVIWPPNLQGVPDVGEDTPDYVVAGQIHAQLQKKILGEDEEEFQLGGRCRMIDCTGGGAAGFVPGDAGGLKATTSSYSVHYGHPFNRPEVLK